MKAAVFYGKEDLRIETVGEPSVGPGEVKLRNAFSGICGSDLHMYYTPGSGGIDLLTPHPLTGSTLPQILGHEFSGTVVEVGDGVTSVKPGDRAAVYPVYYCGECAACERGLFNACRSIGFHGVTSDGGGMAEYTVVPSTMLHVLPPSVDLKFGALVEPMAVAWHAVRRSGVKAGQSALIAGAGPIGIGLWFALKAQGVTTVLVSEPSAERRAAISGVGADLVVDPMSEDLAARVAAETNGAGVDVAFDAAGVGVAISSAIPNLAPGGRLVIVATHERSMDFAPGQLLMGETEIAGTLAYLPEDFDAVIEAMSNGFYDVSGWVDIVDLNDVEDAIIRLRSGKGMKILVSAPAANA